MFSSNLMQLNVSFISKYHTYDFIALFYRQITCRLNDNNKKTTIQMNN